MTAGPIGEDEDVDWFGSPIQPPRPRTPVPCPRCGDLFTEQDALAAHVATYHGITVRRHPIGAGRRARINRWWGSLGFLPLWLVLPLNLVVVAIVVTWIRPVNPWWAAYAGALCLLPLVLVLAHRQAR